MYDMIDNIRRICDNFGYHVQERGILMENITKTIQQKAEELIAKLRADDKLLEKFNRNPAGVLEEYLGVDVPDDQVNALVQTVKAKLTADKLGSALGGLFRK